MIWFMGLLVVIVAVFAHGLCRAAADGDEYQAALGSADLSPRDPSPGSAEEHPCGPERAGSGHSQKG